MKSTPPNRFEPMYRYDNRTRFGFTSYSLKHLFSDSWVSQRIQPNLIYRCVFTAERILAKDYWFEEAAAAMTGLVNFS